MIQDIYKCSHQTIKNALGSLDEFKDYVFWIRTPDMSKQIYVSDSYQTIWGREATILFDIPIIWVDYLAKEHKLEHMQRLQNRHIQNYLDYEKNLVLYKVTKPTTEESSYIRDRTFRLQGQGQDQYVAGVARKLTPTLWYPQFEMQKPSVDKEEKIIYKKFFYLLNKEFGLSLMQPMHKKSSNIFTEFFNQTHYAFSKREMECLYYICQGKSYKEVAKQMCISPRTVETHIENIRSKVNCNNKVEVVTRFSHFFRGNDLNYHMS